MLDGAYGARLAKAFHLDQAPTLVCENTRGCCLAATEIGIDGSHARLTEPIFSANAYMVGMQLRSLARHEVWLRSGLACSSPIDGGSSGFYDLAEGPVLHFDEPMHAIYFYVPRNSLADLGDCFPRTSARGLNIRHGQVVDDAFIRNISQSLAPYFGDAGHANGLVVDYLLLALRGHLALTYGGVSSVTRIKRCGLAPWQQRVAKELMREHLAEGISLQQVSAACRLSPSAFVRAFKKSLGITPHQWLLSRRIEYAEDLLSDGSLSLVEVALAAGFADQSHFTRIFTRRVGVSPGAYRRAHCTQAA